jgi:hypothetical protein
MKIRYKGPHQGGVDVVMPDGSADVHVPHSGLLDTSTEHAEALLEQTANWEPAKASKKPDHSEKDGDK